MMYESNVNLMNVSVMGYTFTIEGNSPVSIRGKFNNYGLPTSKFMSMNKMARGIQAIVTDKQFMFYS
jgi:hypothetical protein